MLNPLKIQQQASDPNISVWVMASAGSGKTKVLTDRILRLLLDGVEPQKILCLTYTKVASVEMQKRLYGELQKWAICNENELNQKLFDLCGIKPNKFLISKARSLLISNLDAEFKIKIQTIHSFCKTILQGFPFEAKIPINFELIEENRAKILLKNCQKNILAQALNDKILHDIIVKINSQTSDSTLSELISQLLNKKDKISQIKNKYFELDDLSADICKRFKILESGDAENITEKIFNNFISNLNIGRLKAFCANASEGTKTDIKSCELINNFIAEPKINNFDYLLSAFYTEKNSPRKFSKKITEIFLHDIEHFYQCVDDFNQQIQALITISNSINLIKIVDRILQEFQKIKLDNGFLDYGDLINIANQILIDPKNCEWIKLKMDSSFDHLLVDEAQDTNPIQWSIIKALIDDFFSGETKSSQARSIFIVGDEKQSIMGFQGADINQTKNFYDYLCYKSNYTLKNVDLNVSFRSGEKILQLVDCVFGNEKFQQALCKIGNYKNHISYRSSVGYAEIWQYENDLSEAPKIDDSSSDNSNNFFAEFLNSEKKPNNSKDLIAKIVADKIKQWVDGERLIADKNRKVEYGDIMILVRNRQNGLMEKLSNNLSQLAIPYVSVGKIKFSENLLIQDFLSLARFALLQSDSFNLACLLKSPFFNIGDQELLELCLEKNSQNLSLWHALKNSKYGDGLNKILSLAKNCNSFEFFFAILNNKINNENIVARFGEESLEIINNFLFICQDFSKSNSPNLQNFLEFVEKIDPEISVSSTQNNCVKITTVHSSKGLQSPIVIMPDCSYSYSKQSDNKEKIIWDEDFPLWISKNAKVNSQIKNIFDNKISQNYEEHLRLLYVALTRAEDEIYIGGISDDSDEKCWYNIINSINNNCLNKIVVNSQHFSLTKNINNNNSALKTPDFNFVNSDINYSYNKISSSLIFGDYLHKALEIIGRNHFMPHDWLINFVDKFLKNFDQLSAENRLEIVKIVSQYLSSSTFNEIFKSDPQAKIYCEYEISNSGKNFRIDLLRVGSEEILIIDYKSDEKAPDQVPEGYYQQIKLYGEIVKKAFPQHKIRCAILWIRFLKLDFIAPETE